MSLGGCFVQTLATPTAGDETQVTITFGKDVSITFAGKVIYVEPTMGFAVKFNELRGNPAAFLSWLESEAFSPIGKESK